MEPKYIIKTSNLNKPPLTRESLRPAPRRKKKWYEQAAKALLKFLGIVGAAFRLDHVVGFGIVKSAIAIAHRAAVDFRDTKWVFVERVRVLRQTEFRNALLLFLLLAMVSWGALKSASLVAYGQQMKAKVLGIATLGGDHLKEAQDALENQNFHKAQNEFLLAQSSFNNSKGEIERANVIIKGLSNLLPQKRDAERLLEASSLISQSGARLLDFQREADKIKVSQGGLEASGEKLSDVLERVHASIEDSTALVEKAEKQVNKINTDNIPEGQRSKVKLLKDNIAYLSSSLRNLRDIFGLLKTTFTGKKNVLFLFENNNELRASGGFAGTYGAMVLDNGKITNLRISSIYELDGQLKEKIMPPSPIMNVNDRWYLRDANWFANFPETAQKVSGFYEKEGGETPDIVVAMTARLVQDLLHVTGPIEMPSYGVTLTEENFIETTQVETSMQREHATNNPKQLLADFFPLLLQRLSEMPASQTPALIEALNSSFNSKHIVLYSRDSAVQEQLESFGWAGQVAATDRDYLSVVSSNLGGTKTDVYMSQVINLETNIQDNGEIFNTLTISRANMLPKSESYKNVSFIRVLVPEGSELLEVQGFDYKNLDVAVLKDRKKDLQGSKWENSVVRHNVTGTYIGKEAGKTFFGNWLEVQGGETRSVKIVYKLPFKVRGTDRYSLLAQKQIGSENSAFNYSIRFGNRKMAWANFSTDNLETGSLAKQFILDKDYFFGLVLASKQN